MTGSGKLIFLAWLAFLGCAIVFSGWQKSMRQPAAVSQSKPNIVLLMMDDLDLRLFQDFLSESPRMLKEEKICKLRSEYFAKRLRGAPTYYDPSDPAFLARKFHEVSWINQIKNQGVEFTRFFATDSLCCPSRATLLTGQCAKNHGVLNVKKSKKEMGLKYWMNPDGSPKAGAEDSALPVWLKNAGYFVGHIGKYLNGYGSGNYGTARGWDYIPVGYDFWRGLTGISTYSMFDFWVNEQGQHKNFSQGEYQTEVLTQYAQEFVGQASTSQKPFMLFLMTAAPHVEEDYTSEYESASKRYSESIRASAIYDSLRDNVETSENPELHPSLTTDSIAIAAEDDRNDKPIPIATQSAPSVKDRNTLVRQYKDRLASLFSVDDLLGVLMISLEAKGLLENTVFVITSDNGYLYGEHTLNGKNWAYDPSIHLPLIVSSPNTQASSRVAALAANTDLAPTLVEIAGAKINSTTDPNFDVDGRSLVSLIKYPELAEQWPRRLLFIESFLAGGNEKSNPSTFAAIRYFDEKRDFLYTHYFDDAEKQSGKSSFTELYDHNGTLSGRGDPNQDFNIASQLYPGALGLKVGLDQLIRDYASTATKGKIVRELEDRSFDKVTGNREYDFTGCLIQYTSCPKYYDFHPRTLGELNGKNYFVEYTTEEKCLDYADKYAAECSISDLDQLLEASYFKDGAKVSSRSRPVSLNHSRLLSVLPTAGSTGARRDADTRTGKSAASSSKVNMSPAYTLAFPTVGNFPQVPAEDVRVEIVMSAPEKESEGVAPSSRPSLSPSYEVVARAESQTWSLGKFSTLAESVERKQAMDEVISSAIGGVSNADSNSVNDEIKPSVERAVSPSSWDSRDIKLKISGDQISASLGRRKIRSWKRSEKQDLVTQFFAAKETLLRSCLMQKQVKVTDKEAPAIFEVTDLDNPDAGQKIPLEIDEGLFSIRITRRDTGESWKETHYWDALLGGGEVMLRALHIKSTLLDICQSRAQIRISKDQDGLITIDSI